MGDRENFHDVTGSGEGNRAREQTRGDGVKTRRKIRRGKAASGIFFVVKSRSRLLCYVIRRERIDFVSSKV